MPVPVLGAVGSVSGLLELSEFVFLLTPPGAFDAWQRCCEVVS